MSPAPQRDVETNKAQRPKEQGLVLGVLLLAVLIVPQIVAVVTAGWTSGTLAKGSQMILQGLHMQYFGVLFLLSYFFDSKCFFFRWLIWVCEHLTMPRSRRMAFFYFALGFGLGTWVLLIGLGVVPP